MSRGPKDPNRSVLCRAINMFYKKKLSGQDIYPLHEMQFNLRITGAGITFGVCLHMRHCD